MVRELADAETATPATHFVDDTELTARINEALRQLYDRLVAARGQEYYATAAVATSFVAGTAAYNLPADFYQLLGARVTDGTYWAQCEPWGYQDLAALLNESAVTSPTIHRYRYRLQGGTIVFRPTPRLTSHSYVIDYVPAMTALVLGTDTFDGINGWERWAALTAAIDIANKEESDPSGLIAQRAVIDDAITRLGGQRDAGRPVAIQDTRGDRYGQRRAYEWAKTVP
jgi:hypothetical protein